MRKENGITLIALIITIIILIILAGVAISITVGENGLLNKAKETKEKYTVESIREKVEIGIMNQEIKEISLGNEVTIELILQKLMEDGIFETIDKDERVGDIGEYEVKLKYNEEGKVVIEYIEKSAGVQVTYTLDPVGYTNADTVNILLNVKGKVKSVTKPDGLIIYPENGILAIDYEVTANGTYTFVVEDEEGNEKEKNVIVDIIDRLAPNDFTIVGANTGTGIKITADAIDADSDAISVKSGIEKYEYFVKGEKDTEYTKYETREIEDLNYGIYTVYVVVYDKARNTKTSDTITVTVEELLNSRRYVDYGIDLNGNGKTTDDWMIFYEEEDETSEYYGATYIISASFVPYSKMKTSISNAGMTYNGSTYNVYWSSAPTNFIKNANYDTVKEIFMYNYTGTTNDNAKCVSTLLNTDYWKDDFVTEELKAKGGLAIGGPTLNMWCASWNKEYPSDLLKPTISGTGYLINGVNGIDISSYKGYEKEAPNVYFPAKQQDSNDVFPYLIASTVSGNSSLWVSSIRPDGLISGYSYLYKKTRIRPLVYLPSSVKLEESETPNLWNINYGD